MELLTTLNEAFTTTDGVYRRGIIPKIAEQAGVTPQTVRNIMKRRRVSIGVETKMKVLQAAENVYNELKPYL